MVKKEEKFSEAERKGRNYVQRVFDTCPRVVDYYFTPDKYCFFDVGFTSANTECIGEIKYREGYASTARTIVEDGAMLEVSKQLRLMNDGRRPVYIMLFNDDIGYWFDLSELDFDALKLKYKDLPKTTVINTGNSLRPYFEIPLDKGKRFIYTRNKKG